MPRYKLKLYEYRHVDGQHSFVEFEQYARSRGISDREANRFRDALLSEFTAMGWEGDGTLEAGFIPAGTLCNAKAGTMFHVKQSNNGTSYIASVQSLDSDGIGEVEFHGFSKLYSI